MSWFCGCVNFFCGGWCAVSVKAVAWVLDDLQGLKPGPTLVMLALADFADERNSCFPGQKTLAARARCSKRSVINYLKELQDLGLLSVETRFYSNGDSGIRRSSNHYDSFSYLKTSINFIVCFSFSLINLLSLSTI